MFYEKEKCKARVSGPDKMKEDFEKLQQERVPMKIFIDVGSQGKQWKTVCPPKHSKSTEGLKLHGVLE